MVTSKEKTLIKILIGLGVVIILCCVIALCILFLIGIDSINDTKVCKQEAGNLITEEFYNLKCYANDNFWTIDLSHGIVCGCYYTDSSIERQEERFIVK